MKVIIVYARGRKNGFSAKAADTVAAYFEQRNNEVKRYYLHDMNFHACRGCFACRRKEGCVQKDDMSVLFNDIISSDFVVFASPVYCFDVCATYKLMFERLYPMLGGGMALGEGMKKYTYRYPRKKSMLLLSMGASAIMCSGAIRRANRNLKFNGFDNRSTIVIDGTYNKKKPELTNKQINKITAICDKLFKSQFDSMTDCH